MNKRRRHTAKARRRATLMVDHCLQRIRHADTERMSIKTYVDLTRLMRETGTIAVMNTTSDGGHQQRCGLRGDPGAPRTVDAPTRE